MLMTNSTNKFASYSDAELKEHKRDLESGLAGASAHGVEVPRELVAELEQIHSELAKRKL